MSTEPEYTPDRHDLGFGLGCVCQVVFFFLGWIAVALGQGKAAQIVFVSWGLTQWPAIIPFFLFYNRRNQRRTAQGLLISGCFGVLLSSACAAMMFNN